MYVAILLMMFAGDEAPRQFSPREEPPFVTHAACDEWAAQEARRIERALDGQPEDARPVAWEIKCIPSRTPVEG